MRRAGLMFVVPALAAGLLVVACSKKEEQPPPQQGGFPPQQGGYPPQQGGYPPQQGGYPPQQPQGQYPPPAATGAPPPATGAPAPAPQEQLSEPGPNALACNNPVGCGTSKCNPQFNKCIFPCKTNFDCVAPNACNTATGVCLPAMGQ